MTFLLGWPMPARNGTERAQTNLLALPLFYLLTASPFIRSSRRHSLAVSVRHILLVIESFLYTIAKLQIFLSVSGQNSLVQTLVIPQLDYCSLFLSGLPLSRLDHRSVILLVSTFLLSLSK